MKKKRRGYVYYSDYGSRDILDSIKRLKSIFKFPKKRKHKRKKFFAFYNDTKINFYPPMHKIGSIEMPLDSIGVYDEEESNN